MFNQSTIKWIKSIRTRLKHRFCKSLARKILFKFPYSSTIKEYSTRSEFTSNNFVFLIAGVWIANSSIGSWYHIISKNLYIYIYMRGYVHATPNVQSHFFLLTALGLQPSISICLDVGLVSTFRLPCAEICDLLRNSSC